MGREVGREEGREGERERAICLPTIQGKQKTQDKTSPAVPPSIPNMPLICLLADTLRQASLPPPLSPNPSSPLSSCLPVCVSLNGLPKTHSHNQTTTVHVEALRSQNRKKQKTRKKQTRTSAKRLPCRERRSTMPSLCLALHPGLTRQRQ